MKIKFLSIFLLSIFVFKAYAQETFITDGNTIETDAHKWDILSVEIVQDQIVVKKIVTPKSFPTWICNSGKEYIEDKEKQSRYYIEKSDIGFIPKKFILNSTDPFIYKEYYPIITSVTKAINISNGTNYYAQNVNLDWDGYKREKFDQEYVNKTLLAIKKEKNFEALNLSLRQAQMAEKLFSSKDLKFAQALGFIGICYSNIGNYKKALEYAETALSIYQEISHSASHEVRHPDEIAMLNNIGQYNANLGNYMKAIKVAKEVTDETKKQFGENSLNYVQSLSNLATYNVSIGNIEKGIDILKTANDICKQIHIEHQAQTKEMEKLRTFLENMGDTDRSQKMTEQLHLMDISLKFIESSIQNNLGVCLWEIGEKEESLEKMKSALTLRESSVGKKHSSYIESQLNLAMYQEALYNMDVSRDLVDILTVSQARFGENHPLVALIMNNLSLIEMRKGNNEKAITYAKKALKIREAVYGTNHIDYLRSILTLSFTLKNAHQEEDFEKIVLKGLKLTKELTLSNLKIMSSVQRENFWNANRFFLELPLAMIDNQVHNKKEVNRASYDAILQIKNLLLTTSVEFERIIRRSEKSDLIQKYERMKEYQRILAFYGNKPLTQRPQDEMQVLKDNIEQIEIELINQSKDFADLTRKIQTSWEDVKSNLSNNEIAIEICYNPYSIGDLLKPNYSAYVLKREWDAPIRIELGTAKLINSLAEEGCKLYTSKAGQELYRILFDKIKKYIKENDTIFFSPAGAFHNINIGALPIKKELLVNDRYHLKRILSTREVVFRERKEAINSAVLIGGLRYNMSIEELKAEQQKVSESKYIKSRICTQTRGESIRALPGSYIEVKRIERSLSSANIKVHTYTGKSGIEERVKSLSGNSPSIIHLATHGFYIPHDSKNKNLFYSMLAGGDKMNNSTNVLKRSGLMLSGGEIAWKGESLPDNIEDGILTSDEISVLDLSHTELVALSACKTALGTLTSEGVYGLQRAFKLAGVKSIVMSLWDIDDKAAMIMMNEFYKFLADGFSKDEAFTKSQQELRSYKEYASPRYWASFIMLE